MWPECVWVSVWGCVCVGGVCVWVCRRVGGVKVHLYVNR